MKSKIKIGILGSTGYTGVVLVKLLLNHPNVEIAYLGSEQHVGKLYSEIYPTFFGILNKKCESTNPKTIANQCDLVFCATPHGFTKDFIPKLLNENSDLKIIDLSADLRLEEKLLLKKHRFPISYGLPELYRKEIKKAQIIANPGCYPTSAILGLLPAIENNLIDLNSIIIDSKSGTSGAGKQPKQDLLFCELNESFSAYSLAGKHRHIPEIENEISKAANKKNIKLTFSPHLLPINRGILSTIYADLKSKSTETQIHKMYTKFYKNEYFVKVLPEGIYANTKHVRYTNFCHISVLKDERTNKLVIISSIDNMVKGASGQAIQNMNIMFGFKESLGLDSVGQIP